MITKDYLPPNTPIVSNFLVLEDVSSFVTFAHNTFDAQVVKEHKDSLGNYLNASLRIENAIITIEQVSLERKPTMTSMLIYVENVEAVIENAHEYASVKHQPTTNSEGERVACIEDKWGNLWWLASALGK
ncbi:hypothetical protein [Vibrio fluminensis]|uniref:hypothetical protein n=1 Tax=Vibrio fluminensis TaxID=2783614 RepID=UPI0018898E49|nr:hypothetical protein [Vibrio fluminensis]